MRRKVFQATLSLFLADLKGLFRSPVSALVAIGLILLPALYAWFITLGFWDPYANTGNLKVAVANNDEGYQSDLLPLKVTAGDDIVSALRANDQFNWRFVTEQEAADGVTSGKYYAAIVIPETFSADLLSAFSAAEGDADEAAEGDSANDASSETAPTRATIVYYTNQKENAIAPRVTDTGASTLQQQIDETFTEVVSEIVLSTTSNLVSLADGDSITAYATLLLDNLDAAIEQLRAGASQAQALSGLASSTAALISENSATLSQLDESLSALSPLLEQSRQALEDIAQRIDEASQAADGASGNANATDNGATSNANASASSAEDGTGEADVPTAADSASPTSPSATTSPTTLTAAEAELRAEIEELATRLNALNADVSQLAGSAHEAAASLSATAALLSANLQELEGALSHAASLLSESADSLQETRDRLAEALASGDLEAIRAIIGSDPSRLAAFLAAPTQLDRHPVYAVANNGSAMSPFYTTLCIWIGSVFLAALMRTDVSPARMRETGGSSAPSPAQLYLGRYGAFLTLALAQATVVCAGNILFLGVQCEHPGLYLLTGWATALVFSNIVYTLAASFGNIGKAIAIIGLVLQLAGSGGIFPVQMSAPFFQVIYPWLPFTHAMEAFQSCVAGIYIAPADAAIASEYLRSILALLAFLIPTLLLGLILRRPVIRLNAWMAKKLEETGVM